MIGSYFQKMNRRERVLAGGVGLMLFLLVNLFLWSWLLDAVRSGRAQVAQRKLTRDEQNGYLRDADLWNKREAWLKAHQPAAHGASDASALLDQLKQIASKYNVLIENPAINNGDNNGAYQSVYAAIETKSPWPALVHFLYDAQLPESFIVFENATISVDGTDATQMRGKFKIARWYAPTGGSKPK